MRNWLIILSKAFYHFVFNKIFNLLGLLERIYHNDLSSNLVMLVNGIINVMNFITMADDYVRLHLFNLWLFIKFNKNYYIITPIKLKFWSVFYFIMTKDFERKYHKCIKRGENLPADLDPTDLDLDKIDPNSLMHSTTFLTLVNMFMYFIYLISTGACVVLKFFAYITCEFLYVCIISGVMEAIFPRYLSDSILIFIFLVIYWRHVIDELSKF